jgi:hypothetical protein
MGFYQLSEPLHLSGTRRMRTLSKVVCLNESIINSNCYRTSNDFAKPQRISEDLQAVSIASPGTGGCRLWQPLQRGYMHESQGCPVLHNDP